MEFNFDGMNLPFPAARINKKAEITAINPVFSSRFALKAENSVNYKLSDIMESYNPQIAEQDAVIRAKSYKVFTVEDTGENDEIFYNVYIIEKEEEDETGINNIVVGLIFVDNYNEVLETMESVRHPLITAIIDRKINNMAYELKGIISKTEKDKYIMIITADKLKHLEENKFPILDVIREINMGNSIPVTLSVGFGIHGSSLMKNMEYARAAVDLALSRGGDQVLIKDEEEYKFYGGRQKEYGANSRVRARVKAYALTELIQESKKVIIMGHKNSDMDCLGAAVGVHRIVKSFEKECKIVLEGVNTAIKRLFDRLMKEDDYCDSFIDSEEALEMIDHNTLLIIVDNFKREICECPELIDKANRIVVFDHHRKSAVSIDNPVLVYHEPYASSTSELVTEMLQYINRDFKLSEVEADALLAGIMVDTKNFAFKTGIKTFETAAFLKRKGADSIRVKLLFQSSFENYVAKTEIVKKAKKYRDNIAISVCDEKIENPVLMAAVASDEMLNIYGIEASFVLCAMNDRISVSARSLGNINVQIIMEKLGGGGHQAVSAAQIKKCTMEEALEKVHKAIDEYFEEEK